MHAKPEQCAQTRATVTEWRERMLASAGFDDVLATRLAAERDVDLHALLELVDRGCPPPLAARILAPLGWDGL